MSGFASVSLFSLLFALVAAAAGAGSSDATPEASVSSPVPVMIGMNPLGGPTIVGDAAYGVTTSGGQFCRAPRGATEKTGCGALYRFDRSGRFTIVHTFEHANEAPYGMLVSSPDARWLYGETGSYGRGLASATTFYRFSSGDGRLETLARGRALFSQAATLDRDVYVIMTPASPADPLSATLARIDPSNGLTAISTFPNRIGISAPVIDSSGSLDVIANEPTGCGVDVARIAAGRVQTLFHRDSAPRVGGRCFTSGEPSFGLTATPSGLLSLNAHEVIRITSDGTRSIGVRLAQTLGEFVGGLVAANGLSYALSSSATQADSTCTRLLRIDGNSNVSVVHAFARADGRCVAGGDYTLPRLAIDGHDFVITTTPSSACSSDATKHPAACGAIVRLRADGSEYAAHDFVQPAEFADGGASGLAAYPAAVGRTFRVQLARSGLSTTPPFSLDVDASIVITGSDGRSRRIAGTTMGRVVSHRSGPDGFESVDLTGQQIASLDFPLPADLPADRYDVVLAGSVSARSGSGQNLDTPIGAAFATYVPPSNDADLDYLRRTYGGKNIFGVASGISGACPDQSKFPVFPANAPTTLVSIERERGAALELATFATGHEFLSVEPLLVTFRRPHVAATHQSTFGALADTPDGGIFSDLGDRAKTCQVLSTVVAGTWQFERTFSLAPTDMTTWPNAFQAKAKDGRLALGMTHAMVAAVWGYPSEFGSPIELARLPFWDYGMFASVRFAGDRVSEINVVDRDAPADRGSKLP